MDKATPTSGKKRNGKVATPNRKKKGPGDGLGNGLSQCPITRYYLPLEKSSPIGGSTSVKRLTSEESPQLKKTKWIKLEVPPSELRSDTSSPPKEKPPKSSAKSQQPKKKNGTKSKSLSKKTEIVVLSSDDSMDDVFTQYPRTDTKQLTSPSVPKSRLNKVKRRLHLTKSSPASTSSPKPRTSRLVKPTHKMPKPKMVLDSESEEEILPMNNSHVTPKPLRLAPQSSQASQVRRSLCPDTSSQAVVITSSDESDFELHNSRQSQSFPSQTVSGISPQSAQKSIHQSQTNRSIVEKPSTDTQTVLKKRCFLDSSDNVISSSPHSHDAAPLPPGLGDYISSSKHQSACFESLPPSPQCLEQDSAHDSTHMDQTPAPTVVPLSIYLQETIPPQDDSGCDLMEPDGSGNGWKVEVSPSSHNESSSCEKTLPPAGHAIYNEETIDPEMNPDAELIVDSTLDFNNKSYDDPITNEIEATVHGCVQKDGVIEASDDEDDFLIKLNHSAMQTSANDRTSLGGIPLPELLNVSHISDSDQSNFSDIHSDAGDLSIIETSVDMYPMHTHALASSLPADDSDESSCGITPILKSVMNGSDDLFPDLQSSCGIGEEQDRIADGEAPKNDHKGDRSLIKEIANIALDVAGLGMASESDSSSDVGSKCGNQSEDMNYVDCPKMLSDSKSDPSCLPKEPQSAADGCSRVIVGSETDILPEKDAFENGENPCNPLQPGENMPSADGSSIADEPSNATLITNGVSAEMKIVCGTALAGSPSKLHIVQQVEKTLLQNFNGPLLLDTVISECQNFAEPVLSQEPLKSFVSRYSDLPQISKSALHSCLSDLLEDSNRWLKYSDQLASSIDALVTAGILQYLNENEDMVTKLNYLTFYEITDILTKLSNSPSKSIEIMKKSILNKFSSAYTCDRVQGEVINLINEKFVRLTESASSCITMCLELFILPLNLCDKFYKTVDVARYASTLIWDMNLNKGLPLKLSKLTVNERVLSDLSALCRLKSNFSPSVSTDELIFRANDICSSIAVLDVSAEFDVSLKTCPTYKSLVANYVHALNEQLKPLLNGMDIEFSACIYLGVLLKQNVTGYQHRVKWCRERMKHLVKLFDSNVFVEFSKILKEPVSPVEFVVRSEFVTNTLKLKKIGLSPNEKSRLTNLLRPISHKKTQICLVPSTSHLTYNVLTRKTNRGKATNSVRAFVYQKFKTDFPSGVEDNGGLLFNAIFLAFWPAIYLNLDGMFVNQFQKSPLDWGSEEFFSKRRNYIDKLTSEMRSKGLPFVITSMNRLFEQFVSHRCVLDWQLVAPNVSKMLSLLEALGLDTFLKIGVYLMAKLDERVLGFPDLVVWNPETKTVKFLGLKKPSDVQYPYQILWLEKLQNWGVDCEELDIFSSVASEERC